MDPLSILTVAAAAVQFLDFGSRIIADTKETYISSLSQKKEHIDLSLVANDVKRLTGDIESKLSEFTSEDMTASGQQTGDPRQFGGATKNVLIRLCHEANEIGDELQVVLDTLQARGKTKLSLAAGSFVAALRGIWSEKTIKNLRDRLDRIHKQIMLETLVLTWGQATKNHVTMVDLTRQQAGKLDVIDKTTRNLNEDLMNLLTNLLKIQTAESHRQAQMIRKYALESKWQPSEQMQVVARHGSDTVNEDRSKRLAQAFVQTLRFHTMRDREEGIPKTYANTCEWIFQNPRSGSDGVPLWSDFSQWLSGTSNEIYWITGKPGAGKSTLVKFIASNGELNARLGQWAGPSSITYLATYYSWNAAGNGLQKSHEGLLRTLLYQYLSQCPELLVPVVFPHHWALFQLSDSVLGSPEWNMSELTIGFRGLLSQVGRKLSDEVLPFKLAIIIDGLDEFETKEHGPLTDLLKEANTHPSVKICASSRPWNVFRDAFLQSPMLQLENLTRQDTEDYVNGQFQSSRGFQEQSLLQPLETRKLLSDILDKAQGVFLWVSVVTRELLARLQEGDKLSDLREAVDALPDDLSTLFQVIWRRTNSQYHGEAAQYFSILNVYHEHNLVPYALGFWLGGDDNPLDIELDPANESFLSSGISSLKRRLSSRTRGLLDIYPGEMFDSGRVDYLHRTVKEWIDQNRDDIHSTINQDFDPNLWILKGEILRMPIENYLNLDKGPRFRVYLSSLFQIAKDVCETPSNNAELVAILDRLDTQVMKVVKPQHHTSHWCFGVRFSWDNSWEHQQWNYQINFIGLMAQVPIPNYLKTKLLQDSSVVKTTSPIVSVLLSTIIGGIPSHPLHLSWEVPREEDALIRLELVEFMLPFIPMDQVKSTLLHISKDHVIAGLRHPAGSKYMADMKTLLRANIKTRGKSIAKILVRKAKRIRVRLPT
ncbi:hypothetical protein F4818DRAFT_241423 [Hypoxylon cercidicola]|nr:hypothetical protein F4818DRAFT_241423 [Hypoxylon cercidicola]